MEFWDCNCMIGRRPSINDGAFHKVEDLLYYMQNYGISKAIVSCSVSIEYDALYGNDYITELLGNNSNLMPSWAILPNHTGEFLSPAELIRKMRLHNVKLVTMFPLTQGFSLEHWCCGELLQELNRYKVPILLDYSEIDSSILYELLYTYSSIPIILKSFSYNNNRILYPLLKKFDNLFLESSSITSNMGIEEICEKFSAHRIIFGSGMPIRSGASSITTIKNSDISEEEKELIASKNFQFIMEGILYD